MAAAQLPSPAPRSSAGTPSMAAPLSPSPPRRSRSRSIALAIVLWAFGLSTTTLLVGVWGRSVASDEAAISTSISSALDAETMSDQLTEWVVDEALSLPGSTAANLDAAVQQVATSPTAQTALEKLIEDFITAASAPPGASTVIDVRSSLEPLSGEVASALTAFDIEVSPTTVDGLLTQLEGLVLTSSEPVLAQRPVATAVGALTVVMLVGAGCLLAFGSLAAFLSGEPLAMLRTLANRLVVSAATFAIFLRISAWAIDPGGGRAPIRTGGAVLLGSNQGVVWALALVGVGISAVASAQIRSRRAKQSSTTPPDLPGPAEPILIGAGRR